MYELRFEDAREKHDVRKFLLRKSQACMSEVCAMLPICRSGAGTFARNTSHTVKATPKSGYRFVRWTERGVERSTSPAYAFTLTADRTLVAVFARNP